MASEREFSGTAQRVTSPRACSVRAWMAACVAALAVVAAPPVSAQGATVLTFEEASDWFHAHSDQAAAYGKAVESAELRRQGMQGLGGPSLSVTGLGYAYEMSADIDLDPAGRAVSGVIGQLPPQVGGAVPVLPSTYNYRRRGEGTSASLSAVWPLYLGGVTDAVRDELDAKTDEALADAAANRDALSSLLVQRYFGAQLAQRAAFLRDKALTVVRQHDAAAQRMLDNGVISRVERLQVQVALAEAEQEARKARDAASLAATALARTLKARDGVQPASPLFVLSRPLPPLERFIESASAHHPGLSKALAKGRQAEYLHDAQEALRRPQVFAFGTHRLESGHSGDNWVAGVAVRWTLWESLDRNTLARATQSKVEQAGLMHSQALSDIALLVEKNWLDVEHARTQFLAQQTQEELAAEVLRLREAGLREGTSTALDLIDARLDLSRVQAQRAQTAFEYVQALAALLESTGESAQFALYLSQADILIPTETP